MILKKNIKYLYKKHDRGAHNHNSQINTHAAGFPPGFMSLGSLGAHKVHNSVKI
jgi:hypothetical protein